MSEFTFTTRHIHKWAWFLLCPSCFILSGAICNCSLLFRSNILNTYWPGLGGGAHLPLSYLFAFLYCSSDSWGKSWSGLPFPPPVDHILSELFTMSCPSWVALHGIAHGFTELCKPLCHDKAVIHEGNTSIRIAKLQSPENAKCCWGCGVIGTVIHCWWENYMVQLFYKTGSFLQKWTFSNIIQ